MARAMSQRKVEGFWEEVFSNEANPALTSILPEGIFNAAGRRDAPAPGVAENVMAAYRRAVEACTSKVNKIIQECRLTNQKYQDPDFDLRHYRNCLDPLVEMPNSNSEPLEPRSHKRVREIFDKAEFFVDGATADDVRQGELADCWFLSALSALCNLEDKAEGNLVELICVHRNEDIGVYGFVFYRDGEWREEIVDDKLYLTNRDYEELDDSETNTVQKYLSKDKGRAETYRKIVQTNSDALFFASSAHQNETWVPLIEKAFAKAHGDYQALDGGFPGEGIEDLTGGLHTYFRSADIVDTDQFWDQGLALVNKTFLWSCETRRVNGKDSKGMIEHHAYAILAAETINDGTRLLKVRNPWGQSEWEGDWSDRSKKWTNEVKRQLDHTYDDDGIFWISYEDLLRICPTMSRTRIFNKDWTVAQFWTRLTVPLLPSDEYENVFAFSLNKDCRTAIVLSRLDHRYYKGLHGQHTYSLSFRLHRAGDVSCLHNCHHRRTNDRSINLEVDLEAGEYQLRVRVVSDWHPEWRSAPDVIKQQWKSLNHRQKLVLTCKNYDIAHSKVPPSPEVDDSQASEESQSDDAYFGHESDHDDENAQIDHDEGLDQAPVVPHSRDDRNREDIEDDIGAEPSEDPTTYESAAEDSVSKSDCAINATKPQQPKTETDSSSNNDLVGVPTPNSKTSIPTSSHPQPTKHPAPLSVRSTHSQGPPKPHKPKIINHRKRPNPQPRPKPPYLRPHWYNPPAPPRPHHHNPYYHYNNGYPENNYNIVLPRPQPGPLPPRPLPLLRSDPNDLSRPETPLSQDASEPLRPNISEQKGPSVSPRVKVMNEPSSTTCLVGLRVYCQGGEARIWRIGEEAKGKESGERRWAERERERKIVVGMGKGREKGGQNPKEKGKGKGKEKEEVGQREKGAGGNRARTWTL